MTDLSIKQYKDASIFLTETEGFLEQQEIKNTFVLVMAHQTQTEEKSGKQPVYYCGTVWDKNNKLVFTILAFQNSFLYASTLEIPEALPLLINDFMKSSIKIQGIHAFVPILDKVNDFIKINSEKRSTVWSYEIKQVQWSSLASAIAIQETAELRVATPNDLPFVKEWTAAFILDAFKDPKMVQDSLESICNDMITSKLLYVLFIEGTPVSMARGVRPLRFGCSLAYVYTPPEYRQKGYGAACVSMCTEALLKKFTYVTLFVDSERDPEDNLYTRVGYHLIGKGGRIAHKH